MSEGVSRQGFVSVRITFSGAFHIGDFVAFALQRAERLAVELEFERLSTEGITLRASGAPDLVDMLEMACALGPISCVVRDVAQSAPERASHQG